MWSNGARTHGNNDSSVFAVCSVSCVESSGASRAN